jgi:branched-chain amino acid transport system substrate-binding protein
MSKKLILGLFIGLLLLALMATAVAGCGGSSGGDTIKIGALLDLTGVIAAGGADCKKGIDLFVKLHPTVAGKTVQLITEDAASDATVSVDKTKKLVESDHVSLIIGPVNGGGGVSVAQYCSTVKVPQFAPLVATDDAANYKYAYCIYGLDKSLAWGLGMYAAKTLGYKTAVSLAADFAPGHRNTDGFKEGFEANGGKVIQSTYYPAGTQNMIPFLTALQKADMVMFWGTPGDCFAFFPQYKEVGLTMPIIQPEDGGVTSSPGMLKNLGDAAIGTVFGTCYLYNADFPGNKDFVAAYQKEYNELPGVMAGACYSDMQGIFAALEKTKGDTDPDKFSKAMSELQTDTIRGPVSFPADQGPLRNVAALDLLIGTIKPGMEIASLDLTMKIGMKPNADNKTYSAYLIK